MTYDINNLNQFDTTWYLGKGVSIINDSAIYLERLV